MLVWYKSYQVQVGPNMKLYQAQCGHEKELYQGQRGLDMIHIRNTLEFNTDSSNNILTPLKILK